MIVKGMIKTGEYFDSVTLMQIARDISGMSGVEDAAVVMGSRENKSILESSDMLLEMFQDTGDADLLIAVKAVDDATAEQAFETVAELMTARRNRVDSAGDYQPKSLEGALQFMPDASLVMISVAGKFAGDVARDALEKGLHVMLFSDNISIETERALKEFGREKGLMVMGPDCGTAIINGTPLAFANVVNPGKIGMVAASGTGLQEISAIISNEGEGISQAIGTGGRDVKDAIGGIMFLEGIRALASDPDTKIISLVSKPPDDSVVTRISEVVKTVNKPVVATFLGQNAADIRNLGFHATDTLEENALLTVALARGESPDSFKKTLADREKAIETQGREIAANISPDQKYMRGLFSGGTLCDETQLIFRNFNMDIYGNAALDPQFNLVDSWKSFRHTVVDLGGDEFTVGRPHPMIDYSLRNRRILEEADDPETAVILLDVVLGFGSNMDPAGELIAPITEAIALARKSRRHLAVVCSITGTPGDPQDKDQVAAQLEQAGAIVMPSNAAASLLAGYIINHL